MKKCIYKHAGCEIEADYYDMEDSLICENCVEVELKAEIELNYTDFILISEVEKNIEEMENAEAEMPGGFDMS